MQILRAEVAGNGIPLLITAPCSCSVGGCCSDVVSISGGETVRFRPVRTGGGEGGGDW